MDAVVDQNATVRDLIAEKDKTENEIEKLLNKFGEKYSVKEIDIFINHLDVSTVSEFKRTFLVRMEIKI